MTNLADLRNKALELLVLARAACVCKNAESSSGGAAGGGDLVKRKSKTVQSSILEQILREEDELLAVIPLLIRSGVIA